MSDLTYNDMKFLSFGKCPVTGLTYAVAQKKCKCGQNLIYWYDDETLECHICDHLDHLKTLNKINDILSEPHGPCERNLPELLIRAADVLDLHTGEGFTSLISPRLRKSAEAMKKVLRRINYD